MKTSALIRCKSIAYNCKLVYPSSPSHADYSKLNTTPFNSKHLRELAVIVVGAGALGNEVARILGLLGTGWVTIVDPDIVEPSNLPRSTFFRAKEAVGQKQGCRAGSNSLVLVS